jgi:hypothetical protein
MAKHNILYISATHEGTLATWYSDAEFGGCFRIHRHLPGLTTEEIAKMYEPEGYRLETKMIGDIPTYKLVREEKISTAFGVFEESD